MMNARLGRLLLSTALVVAAGTMPALAQGERNCPAQASGGAGQAVSPADAECLRSLYEADAAKGDVVAKINLALLLLEEDDPASITRAVNLLKTAAATGDSWSTSILAGLYTEGKKVEADGELAIALLQPLADKGLASAMTGLGDVYAKGAGTIAADIKRAASFYNDAAGLGDMGAKYRLGFMLVRGEGVPVDTSRGLTMLDEVAKGNDPWTLINVGDLYADGKAVPVNAGRAMGYYQRAVDAGNSAALVRMGSLYRSGLGEVQADPEKAAGYFEQAVEAGDNTARIYLAQMLLDGAGVPADVDRAVSLLSDASQTGDVWSSTILAGLYTQGTKVPADGERAMALLEPLAEEGNASALAGLGDIYAKGADPVVADPKRAMALYEEAAALGDLGAKNKLGLMLVDGNGGRTDKVRGLALLREVAAAGDAWAMIQTGDVLASGEGLPVDADGAMDYYRRAANSGVTMGLVKIGGIYRDGLGTVAPDPQQAARYFEQAVEAGDNVGRVSLALMLLDGKMIEPDTDRAVALLSEATEDGDGWATAVLAGLYADGRKLEPDYEKALRLSTRSRELGDKGAMLRLGMMLANGPLARQHGDKGAVLVKQAAAEGVPNAAVDLARLQAFGRSEGDDAADAEKILVAEIEKKNPVALRALLQIYRDGAPGFPAKRREAQRLLDRNAELLSPEAAAYETVALLAYRPATRPALDAIGANFARLGDQDVNQGLQMLFWANKNAYVYVLQQHLRQAGTYNGPVTGLLTQRTITAIKRACVERASAELCGRGPLTPDVAVLMAGYVAEGS
jgi:uncharacterized protein